MGNRDPSMPRPVVLKTWAWAASRNTSHPRTMSAAGKARLVLWLGSLWRGGSRGRFRWSWGSRFGGRSGRRFGSWLLHHRRRCRSRCRICGRSWSRGRRCCGCAWSWSRWCRCVRCAWSWRRWCRCAWSWRCRGFWRWSRGVRSRSLSRWSNRSFRAIRWRGGFRCGRSLGHRRRFKQAARASGLVFGNQDSEHGSQNEQCHGQIDGEFLQHVGGLRTKHLASHVATEGCTEPLLAGTLHEDNKDKEKADDDFNNRQ